MIDEFDLSDLLDFDDQVDEQNDSSANSSFVGLRLDEALVQDEDREDVFKFKGFFQEELSQFTGKGFIE